MKLLLCVALLFGGCYTPVKNYKKPDNTIHQEDLQEKFEEIDTNNDGVIDKAEAKKHEEDQPAKVDPATPMWALFQILGFMSLACILPWAFIVIAGKFRDFREKKRV